MIERNRIYNCDCMDGMAEMPDNFIDLAIVDPPYGIREHIVSGGETGKAIKLSSELARWDVQPDIEYFDELKRVSRNFILWGANYFTQYIDFSRGWIVWDKKQPPGIRLSKAELAYSTFNRNCEIFRFSTKSQTNKIHPTQKPVDLYKWLLSNYAEPGQLICDSHMGSGVSYIAALDLGFDYIGYEIDADYFAAIEDRVYHFTRQTELL